MGRNKVRVKFLQQINERREEMEYYRIVGSIPVSFYVNINNDIKVMEEHLNFNDHKYFLKHSNIQCFPNFENMTVLIDGKTFNIVGLANVHQLYQELKSVNVELPPCKKIDA